MRLSSHHTPECHILLSLQCLILTSHIINPLSQRGKGRRRDGFHKKPAVDRELSCRTHKILWIVREIAAIGDPSRSHLFFTMLHAHGKVQSSLLRKSFPLWSKQHFQSSSPIFPVSSSLFGNVAAVSWSSNSVGHWAHLSYPLTPPPINMLPHPEHSKRINRQQKSHAEKPNRKVASPPSAFKGKSETVSYLLDWLKHTGLSIFRVLLLVLFWESFPRLLAFAEAGETAEGKDASCSP